MAGGREGNTFQSNSLWYEGVSLKGILPVRTHAHVAGFGEIFQIWCCTRFRARKNNLDTILNLRILSVNARKTRSPTQVVGAEGSATSSRTRS